MGLDYLSSAVCSILPWPQDVLKLTGEARGKVGRYVLQYDVAEDEFERVVGGCELGAALACRPGQETTSREDVVGFGDRVMMSRPRATSILGLHTERRSRYS